MTTANPAGTSRYLTANGLTHHYREWGDPSGPPLVMLHGTGHCAGVWGYCARRLAGDFRVMAFDQRGHGGTEDPAGGWTFQALAEDLLAILDRLGLEGAAVVGHSSGGLAAIMADSMRPGAIGKAVLAEVVIQRSEGASGPDLAEVAARTRRKRRVWESREAMFEGYRRRPAYRTWDDEVFGDFIEGIGAVEADGKVRSRCEPEVEAAFYEDRAGLDMLEYRPRARARYLLLLGDYNGPQAQTPDSVGVRRFLEQVEEARVKPMGVGTHFLPMEYPELTLREIRGFLKEC